MRQIFVSTLIFVPLVAHPEIEALCNKKEKTLFTCTTTNKTTSICASNDLSANAGYIRYAHGKNDNVALSYPTPPDLAKNKFKWFYGWSPGFFSFLEFGVGKYTYYVYSSFGNNYNTPKKPGGKATFNSWDVSGVAVFKGSSLITNTKCIESEVHFSDSEVIKLLNSAAIPIGNNELLFDNNIPF